jgi:hypothetical protein
LLTLYSVIFGGPEAIIRRKKLNRKATMILKTNLEFRLYDYI